MSWSGINNLIDSILCDEEVKYEVNIDFVKKRVKEICVLHKIRNRKIIIVGTIIDRLVLIEINKNVFLSISLHKNICTYYKKYWFLKREVIEEYTNNSVILRLHEKSVKKLLYPKVKLVVLYHKENFPYPRFALGVSDICGAVRDQGIGQISLSDMQANKSKEEIIQEIEDEKPDIIGLSVTFGQQDILENIIENIFCFSDYDPLVIVGGTLASLNKDQLLKKYSNLIVCLGYGETTVREVIRYWHKDISINEIPGIAYIYGGKIINTKQIDEWEYYGIPELDLLPDIIKNKGIMTLESSRGCINACSFCPRESKGYWHEINLYKIEELMPFISKQFDRYEQDNKKIFLVDEEFFGGLENKALIRRADYISTIFTKYCFGFETSARIKQVYDASKNKEWHIERWNLLNRLKENSLKKCLFGVESGVDSILVRFNKNTISEENTYGIRILSLLGIPFRTTYITFDPLMNMEELLNTYIYQGRTDIVMKETNIPIEKIYELLHKKEYIEQNCQNVPLYFKIPYMLVSLECLTNSKYLIMVKRKKLVLNYNLNP